MDALRIIQTLVAPVVMISACGLLVLAFYNRLAVLVSRVRAFNHERLELLEELQEAPADQSTDRKDTLKRRLDAIQLQVLEILKRSRLIRNTLVCLVICIKCMVICSLFLGLSMVSHDFEYGALLFFCAGMIILLFGMVFALMELVRCLTPVALEEGFVTEMHRVGYPDSEGIM